MQSNLDLWRALEGFRQRLAEHLHGELPKIPGLDLSIPQSVVLNAVAARGPQTIGELQARLNRSQATMSHLVNQLELRGLVERVDDPDDARRTRVALAKGGAQLLKRLDDARARAFERVLGRVPPRTRRELTRALSATLSALEEEDT